MFIKIIILLFISINKVKPQSVYFEDNNFNANPFYGSQYRRPLFRSIQSQWGVGIGSDSGPEKPEPAAQQIAPAIDIGVPESESESAVNQGLSSVSRPSPNSPIINEIVDSQQPTYSLSFDSKKELAYIRNSTQLEDRIAAESPCNSSTSNVLTVHQLCSLPPDKGSGNDDIFRYYYNPVVQQCIAFSYSGKGGNVNRFVSVKNCYEICHPADPTVKKPRVVSGIKAYLVPEGKACPKKPSSRSLGDKKQVPEKDVVIRQIPNPLDPTKTLTIIQDAKYIQKPPDNMAVIQDGNGNTRVIPTLAPKVRVIQKIVHHETVPYYVQQNPVPYSSYPNDDWHQNSIVFGKK